MSFSANDVAYRVATLLNDTSSVRWTATELVAWMNDAALAIVTNTPDATATTMDVTLDVGTRQQLGDLAEMATLNPYQLLEVVRNTAVTSSLGVVRQVTRTILDSQSPQLAYGYTVNKHPAFRLRPTLTRYVLRLPPGVCGGEG